MNKFLKKNIILVLTFMFLLSPVLISANSGGSAGGPNESVTVTIKNPLSDPSANSISAVLKIVINDLVLPIGALVAVLYIMYAGFLMVTARGDTKQIEQGKAAFFHAAIGTAILLGAWVISQAIASTITSIVTP